MQWGFTSQIHDVTMREVAKGFEARTQQKLGIYSSSSLNPEFSSRGGTQFEKQQVIKVYSPISETAALTKRT